MKEQRLWEVIQKKSRDNGILNACLDLYKSWVEREVELEDSEPPSTLTGFLIDPGYSAWLWTIFSILIATVAVVAVTENGAGALLPARYVLGSITVLFLPGYALIEALYPRREDLEPLERLALSIGLSLALVPLVGLILNYTPWGIRLWPVTASLSILTAALALLGSYRKYKYMELEREAKRHE
ncbi:MAG: DUF1616 domain-containing protein [Infirmifilum sp.]